MSFSVSLSVRDDVHSRRARFTRVYAKYTVLPTNRTTLMTAANSTVHLRNVLPMASPLRASTMRAQLANAYQKKRWVRYTRSELSSLFFFFATFASAKLAL